LAIEKIAHFCIGKQLNGWLKKLIVVSIKSGFASNFVCIKLSVKTSFMPKNATQ